MMRHARASGPARRRGRPPPEPADGLLPAPPRDPASDLGVPLVDRSSFFARDRRLDRGARPRAAAGRAAPVLLRVHPLLGAPRLVPLARRATRTRSSAGAEGDYPIDVELPGAGAAGALVELLPALPRAPGARCLARARRRRDASAHSTSRTAGRTARGGALGVAVRRPRLVREPRRAAGCRRACATPARTASATAPRCSRTSCSSPTGTRTPTRRRCSTASSGRRSTPVRLVGDPHDLRRSRVTVFFRLPARAAAHRLARALGRRCSSSPSIANWFVTLFRGTPAASLHRFLSRVGALPAPRVRVPVSRREPVPGLHGRAGQLPARPRAARARRARTGGRRSSGSCSRSRRSIVSGALGWGLFVVGGPHVVRTRSPRASAPWGLRNFSAYALRYDAQTNAYFLLSPTRTRTRARSRARRRRSTSSPKPKRRDAREPAVARRCSPRSRRLVGGRVLPVADEGAVVAPPAARRRAPLLHRRRSCTRRRASRPVQRPARSGARLLAQLAVLAVFACWGARWARESAAGPVGTGMLLGMLGFALVWAVAAAARRRRPLVGAPPRPVARRLRDVRSSATGSRSAASSCSSASRSRS